MHRAVEHDLETRELAIDVVLGFVSQRGRLTFSLIDDVFGHSARLAHDFGAFDHALGTDPRRLEDPFRLVLCTLDDLVAFLQEPTRFPKLLGQAVDRLLQERAELLPIHRHRCRHEQTASAFQRLLYLQEQRARVGNLAGIVLEQGHASLSIIWGLKILASRP